jgi:hypothetical protein
MALISLVIVFRLRQPAGVAEVLPGTAPSLRHLRPVDEAPPSRDQLDDSRFSGGAQV